MRSVVNLSLAFCLGLCVSLAHAEKVITISESAAYHDEKVIAPNIVAECTGLGEQFSQSTARFLQKSGWQVQQSADSTLTDEQGYALKLVIINAHSAGNAWSGHKKNVVVEAELYQEGELLDTFRGTRNSGGGFGGGFKGSCAVLERCVNTLGKDVSKWLRTKAL